MPQEVFRHCETKNVRRKTRYPLLYMKRFDTPSYLKHWTDAHKIFRHCETKKLQLKNVISTTMHKNVSLHQTIWNSEECPRNFSALWDRNFSQKNTWYPLLYMKLFDTLTFLKPWTDAHRKFRHGETENFCRKNLILFIMYKIFRSHKLSETLKGCAQNFSALRDMKVSTENCDNPYYAKYFSLTQIIWNIEGMPTKFFGSLRPKFFAKKNVLSFIIHETFPYPNFSETLNGSPQNISALWDKKFSTENCDIPYKA